MTDEIIRHPLRRLLACALAQGERIDAIRLRRRRAEYQSWIAGGRVGPPTYLHKQGLPRTYGREFNISTFVETGTYLGDTVAAMSRDFSRIYSIELNARLAARARRRFRNESHIEILSGDSATVLPTILRRISEPSLFWLDAHYSGGITARGHADTPILEELAQILSHPVQNHVILIDDARCFVGKSIDPSMGQVDYPTFEELSAFVKERRPQWLVENLEDVIRVQPPAHSMAVRTAEIQSRA
jgi:hypothetical protein